MTLYSQSASETSCLASTSVCIHRGFVVWTKQNRPASTHYLQRKKDWEHWHTEFSSVLRRHMDVSILPYVPEGNSPLSSLFLFLLSAPPQGSLAPSTTRSRHPRHASWGPFLYCVLPWLLSPTAVWVSQLSPYLPVAPASSAVHCAKCEVIKTHKSPPLGWEEDWKAHICQKRQHAAHLPVFECASRVCQLPCAYTIGSMWLAWQKCIGIVFEPKIVFAYWWCS